MISKKDIICFSSIDWDFNWQIHQEITLELAKRNNRVLFIENTGMRAPNLNDIKRLKEKFSKWWNSTNGFKQVGENIYVYSPLILPFPNSNLINKINNFIICSALKKWSWVMNFKVDLVWIFLPSPLTLKIIKNLNPKVIVYYKLADFNSLNGSRVKSYESENVIINKADAIFLQGKEFLKTIKRRDNVHVFDLGVSTKNFDINVEPSEDLKNLKRPIIGYIGGFHEHIDISLIKRVAKECDGTLVFVGPIQINNKILSQFNNVCFLGSQPYNKLASFMACFDVGIIPYKITEYTKTVYPAKMKEYLSMGLPVVSTSLPEVKEFSKKNENIINIANDEQSFVEQIKKAIQDNSEEKIKKRIEIAKKNDWEIKIKKMLEIVDKTSDEKKLKTNLQNLKKFYQKKKFLIPSLTFLLLLFLIFYTPFFWYISEPLKISNSLNSLENFDAIIVFGGGLGEKVNSDESFQEKLKHAIDLYKNNTASTIVFSSNYKYYFSEAEIMKELAMSSGIKKENIIVDKKGVNTYENLQSIKEIIKEKNWTKVVIVSSPYHTRRAVMTLKKLAPNIKVYSSPAKTRFYSPPKRGIKLEQIKGILYEYLALFYYWWKGYL